MQPRAFYAEEKKDDAEPSSEDGVAATRTRPTTSSSGPSFMSNEKESSAKEHARNQQHLSSGGIKSGPPPSKKNDAEKAPLLLRISGTLLRTLVIDFPMTVLFVALLSAMLLHKVHDDYLLKQLELMKFLDDGRDFTDVMYYHRYCSMEQEISATSVSQLIIPENATVEECVVHQMTHGASVYRDLLTPETAHELREFIVEENKKQKGFYVIQNEHRYSWGIDVNMHPAIKKYWKELASNRALVQALQEIIGPDPAIIEFTAITSAYGAKDQHDHQDVIAAASGVKFPHTFIPSYSLFIPLQDTSYDMGATHVCPGSHLCSEGCDDNCYKYNLAMSGDDDNWPRGWGALVNQQTTHKGMGHTKEGGLDRVVIIATFAPRPQTFRSLETRMIGQGGSYSLAWQLWGHTFSDFVFAEERMWEPLKTMRALGLVKGRGWNLPMVASMRMSNEDNGYNNEDVLDEFIEEKGGFPFLPQAWQGIIEEDEIGSIDNAWYLFLIGTLKRTEQGLTDLYKMALPLCLVTLLSLDLMRGLWTRRWSVPSVVLRGVLRLALLHAIIALLAWKGMETIKESNWAKDIASGKSYRLPELYVLEDDTGFHVNRAILPNELDVLRVDHYASHHLAAYGRVVDFAHPGNAKWNELTKTYAQEYLKLPNKELQKDFCQSLLAYIRQDARFLKQGEEREWLPIEDNDELLDICHQDIVATSNQKTAAMMRALNSLKMTSEYGRFRETAMQRDIIPRYLATFWEPLLVPRRLWSVGQGEEQVKLVSSLSISTRRSTLTIVPSWTSRAENKRRYSIPQSREPREPFPMAWVREGDVVEAVYNCNSQYYYRGTIVAIVSSDSTFDVQYDDGDLDEGLGRRCLRPFEPYQVGEKVQMRRTADKYEDGTIVRIYEKEEDDDDDKTASPVLLFDIQLEGSSEMLVGKPAADARRFDNTTLKKGDRIAAIYNDGDEWFPGKIIRINPDGTYYIRFMDGDIEKSVPKERIRK